MGKVRDAWQKVPPEPALQPSTQTARAWERSHPRESHEPGITDDSWGERPGSARDSAPGRAQGEGADGEEGTDWAGIPWCISCCGALPLTSSSQTLETICAFPLKGHFHEGRSMPRMLGMLGSGAKHSVKSHSGLWQQGSTTQQETADCCLIICIFCLLIKTWSSPSLLRSQSTFVNDNLRSQSMSVNASLTQLALLSAGHIPLGAGGWGTSKEGLGVCCRQG